MREQMKSVLLALTMSMTGAAQAHESLAPHTHPHPISMLPDLTTSYVGVIALAAAVIIYLKYKRG
jgi:hypothetical protein